VFAGIIHNCDVIYYPSKHNVRCNVYVSCNFLLNNV